jgi:exosortase
MEQKTPTNRTWQEDLRRLQPKPAVLAAWLVLLAAFMWFYWTSFAQLTHVWTSKEDYQHCFFVPLFSLYLLWLRRDMIEPFTGRGSLWGFAFFAVWAIARWISVYFKIDGVIEMTMLPFIAGVALFVGGWQGFRWSWPAIFFLAFMIPLPGVAQSWLSQYLQTIAARSSGYMIQTVGLPAVVSGHVIYVGNPPHPMDVERACSGLRMLMLFVALCVGTAFVIRKPLWEKLLIVASVGPIAIASNVARIVLTAVFGEIARHWYQGESAEKICETIHNIVGYFGMMPIGLLLLLLEVHLLSKLLVEPLPQGPLTMGKKNPLAANDAAREEKQPSH